MTNLLIKENFVNELPWGTSLDPYIMNSMPEMVTWKPDGTVEFNVAAGKFKGWRMNERWQKYEWATDYANGMIVSKQQFLYGQFDLVCRLPYFKGSWPAFWFIDVTGKMGVPPEYDVFEQFIKDGTCKTRRQIQTTYHDGPTYTDDKQSFAVKKFTFPVSWSDVKISFIWTADSMTTIINGKTIMTVNKKDFLHFPNQPMNLILGSGVGNWEIDSSKFKPFIIKSLTYTN